ncbi:hypothetical protein HELRODRAFT_188187 [Helobdella robusta]|uniref:Uncharacterized protein n=1 Tax=Helobdella robusta TaxID=6412 RepID=T1FPR3_HELRO|nr:hypothetical protein HELRODRAFT_188187 [Helobdella robusta]ESO05818.1 hypothetical protein HELRODRAFT_188187 [Helobdella robusta]
MCVVGSGLILPILSLILTYHAYNTSTDLNNRDEKFTKDENSKMNASHFGQKLKHPLKAALLNSDDNIYTRDNDIKYLYGRPRHFTNFKTKKPINDNYYYDGGDDVRSRNDDGDWYSSFDSRRVLPRYQNRKNSFHHYPPSNIFTYPDLYQYSSNSRSSNVKDNNANILDNIDVGDDVTSDNDDEGAGDYVEFNGFAANKKRLRNPKFVTRNFSVKSLLSVHNGGHGGGHSNGSNTLDEKFPKPAEVASPKKGLRNTLISTVSEKVKPTTATQTRLPSLVPSFSSQPSLNVEYRTNIAVTSSTGLVIERSEVKQHRVLDVNAFDVSDLNASIVIASLLIVPILLLVIATLVIKFTRSGKCRLFGRLSKNRRYTLVDVLTSTINPTPHIENHLLNNKTTNNNNDDDDDPDDGATDNNNISNDIGNNSSCVKKSKKKKYKRKNARKQLREIVIDEEDENDEESELMRVRRRQDDGDDGGDDNDEEEDDDFSPPIRNDAAPFTTKVNSCGPDRKTQHTKA